MFEALIFHLRECAKTDPSENTFKEAADAIEDLCAERSQMVHISKNEAYALAEHIDMTLIDTIRDNTDIDSVQWVRSMVHAYETLCTYSGYVGLTDIEEDGQ